MPLPGPNQTRIADRRIRLSPPTQVLAHLARPRIKAPAEHMAAALGLDAVARDAGYADGAAERLWDPGEHDMLSYAAGYVAGAQFGRRKP